MTPSAVATSGMTEGEQLQDVEEEVFLLKKDIARMKEDTEENIVLLKRDNARMRVELEQNWEELETLRALVEAMHEDRFPTAPALHDPAVPSLVECPPPGMHGSPPSEHSQCPNISPSIQALLDLPAGLCFCFPISRIHVLNGAGDTPGPSAGTDHQVSAIPASVPLETSDMDISTASTDKPSQVDPTPAITMGIQPSPIITITPPAPEPQDVGTPASEQPDVAMGEGGRDSSDKD